MNERTIHLAFKLRSALEAFDATAGGTAEARKEAAYFVIAVTRDFDAEVLNEIAEDTVALMRRKAG